MSEVAGSVGVDLLEGFARYLAVGGYAAGSVVLRLNLLKHVGRWLDSEGIALSAFDSAAVARFLVARRLSHKDLSSPQALAPLLTFLRSSGMIPEAEVVLPAAGPVDEVLARWDLFLVSERGIQRSTIRYYRDLAAPLLSSRLRGDALDLAGLDARAVSTFVLKQIPGMPVGVAKLTVTALRSLLRFLFISGLITERLDGAVPARAGYRDAGLPRGLRPEQVAALISAIDTGIPIGKRDLAMVLLLARLGFRACEVAALSLDDIDWRAGTLQVPGKGGQIDLLPMSADVGEALAAHLSVGRHPAAEGRALFFGSVAPYRPLNVSAVIAAVRRAGVRAGLGPVGAHRLRHGVATSTINAGASLEEVAQLLRHRNLGSTTIYAKVDLTHLATLARPWPGPRAGYRDGGIR